MKSIIVSLFIGVGLILLGISIIVSGYSFHSGSGITSYYGDAKYFIGGALSLYGAYMIYFSLKKHL